MNSEVPDTSNAPSRDAAPARPADVLRDLLNEPKPKEDDWQAKAGRAASMLAVAFLNEPSDELALRSVALLSLAQSLGVKEVRKRAIKLSRWADAAPPPLATLTVKDEQHAALTALAKLTSSWCRPYIEQALSDPLLPESFVLDLLKWARATYPDNLSFTRQFYAPQLASAKSAERALALLKDGSRLVKPSKPEAATRLAEGIAALVEVLFDSRHSVAADNKACASSVAALLHLVQDHVAAAPAVLLQPAFVIAVGRLSAAASKNGTSKQAATVTEALSLATISLLMADADRFGSQAVAHWRAMVPTWRAVYPGWDEHFASATKVSPALAALTGDSNEVVRESSEAYTTEAAFARLLPAWDAFVADLPDVGRAASLTAMLQHVAGTVGIVPFGEKDSVLSYDPLSHHLVDENAESPKQVCIVRPGVQVRRPDGSARVLLPALVTAV